jgi:putative tricarboxylic transport membrane protein
MVAGGTLAGIYVGAIPGLSVTMAASILISFTFSWEVNPALALIVGVYMGGVYGGSRSAILLNIPGAPSAIATSFDGFPLAQQGEAGKAIGTVTMVSAIGGFIGIIVLATAAPMVSDFALKVAPRDYFLLALMGLLLVGTLSTGSMARGITAGALGAAFGMVGMDPMTAEGRFTFGSVSLLGGISFVAVMIGLFGVSEALHQIHTLHVKGVKQNVDKVLPSWAVILKFLPLTVRTSLIGVIVGALPGTGGDIAALMAYDHAKRTVKNPTQPFGKGAYEGLIAPESANNAAVGGAFIPMLTLGIPGDAVTAVIIGALYIHGLRPGPMLMVDTPHLFWFIVGALVLATIFMVIFGLTGIRVFAKVVEVKKGILNPVIIVLSVIGTYAINNSMTDVYWMLGFGLFGYLLKMYRFQVAPIVLGVILGPLMDLSYRRAVMSTENSLLKFLLELITNPLSCVLTLAVVFMLISQTALWSSFLGLFKKKRTGEVVLEPEC